ncbi:MAG: HD-GYP domain-containing protein [Lachnospiraceae bacterium]|nr:HD-GYP domain-containing protein [Lachnospiraceae bacterium]
MADRDVDNAFVIKQKRMAPSGTDQHEEKREVPKVLFVLLLILYYMTTYYVRRAAMSEAVITVGDMHVPVSSLAGVFSSLANMAIIFEVVYFGKVGFITSLVVLLLQYPVLAVNTLRSHNLSAISGAFTNLLTIVTCILIYTRNKTIDKYQEKALSELRGKQQFSQRLFEQTATALVNAVDAKDTYSHGHSLRVAVYSERIAGMLGKDEEECRKIYYAALLHDVGKIGIPISIINKKGRLTADEYETIKQHTVLGNQILSSISEYPYLSIGAHYHHERYDGHGYPSHLKGEDIPEIARIISVADAYDAMTSNRSYRDAVPQQIVREEIVKGGGTQFDPVVASVMLQLIDRDKEYQMRERNAVEELAGKSELHCGEFKREISDGILVTSNPVNIHLETGPAAGAETAGRGAGLVLFDSLDGRFHDEEDVVRELNYFEYAVIWLSGSVELSGARKVKSDIRNIGEHRKENAAPAEAAYDIEAVRCKDHLRMRIREEGGETREHIIALPDCTRYAYIGLSGENCYIDDVSIEKTDIPVAEEEIPRIAERISYINGRVGDIPNLQVDGLRTASSKGIAVRDGLTIRFHTMSLPTARLIWHCPYILLFSSADGSVNGAGYREYALIRLDGENYDIRSDAENSLTIRKDDDFMGWDHWKEQNKKGIDISIEIGKKGNIVTIATQNLGIGLENTTDFKDMPDRLFVALTGDQCALTDIRISDG